MNNNLISDLDNLDTVLNNLFISLSLDQNDIANISEKDLSTLKNKINIIDFFENEVKLKYNSLLKEIENNDNFEKKCWEDILEFINTKNNETTNNTYANFINKLENVINFVNENNINPNDIYSYFIDVNRLLLSERIDFNLNNVNNLLNNTQAEIYTRYENPQNLYNNLMLAQVILSNYYQLINDDLSEFVDNTKVKVDTFFLNYERRQECKIQNNLKEKLKKIMIVSIIGNKAYVFYQVTQDFFNVVNLNNFENRNSV